MDFTYEIKERIIERESFNTRYEVAMGIRPKMELITTNGKPHGTFDLRLLNSDIKVKKLTNS